MLIWREALGPFATNCYIIACPVTREAAIIDPGQSDPWIATTVREAGVTVKAVWLTHAHLDHIGGVEMCRERWQAPVSIHPADVPMLTDPRLNGSARTGTPLRISPPDNLFQEGQEAAVGTLRFQVLHTPGHTPGGICLHTSGHLIAGDTLFAGSIGRTDFPGGDHTALIRSIRQKLFALPDDTLVYPGHGPETTIGDEKAFNPFVGGM